MICRGSAEPHAGRHASGVRAKKEGHGGGDRTLPPPPSPPPPSRYSVVRVEKGGREGEDEMCVAISLISKIRT